VYEGLRGALAMQCKPDFRNYVIVCVFDDFCFEDIFIACVRVLVCACAYVCVCVCERERERTSVFCVCVDVRACACICLHSTHEHLSLQTIDMYA
jgi:hypothetical protein